MDAERTRLDEETRREHNWKRWGPYLSERQWATVREDYSAQGEVWDYFPHDHARSRAYRWGEDGLLGICDRKCRLAFALGLWNGCDSILKERLFGLTGPQGNHGEDVKECYYYLDATPTHSYLKGLYKYPQARFPYQDLIAENARRDKNELEFEITDAGAFDDGRYFDVTAEYAKADPEDILIRVTVANRGPEAATIHVLPTLWFRNTWSWGRTGEGYTARPELRRAGASAIDLDHDVLGAYRFTCAPAPDRSKPALLFTGNETNTERIFGAANATPYVKDAFHAFVIDGADDALDPSESGTKAAALYELCLDPGETSVLRMRLRARDGRSDAPFGVAFDRVFDKRIAEADAFHSSLCAPGTTDEERAVLRQAQAGLIWSKQFYHYVVEQWIEGDPSHPEPPAERHDVRNSDWTHVYNRDVISMPDKWEYPWYAAWDLAFHMIPFCKLDPEFAKDQMLLLLREWYMHPNGQIPAYEFAFGDVNPPVHAWACWRIYKMSGARGERDRTFLQRAFHKLLLNFTWWVDRKDVEGRHLFSGGFLGLDNIGVFDRSRPLPTGGHLEQADGTAWMAFYCATMLSMALELAAGDPAYEDVASKFFEHFMAIAHASNTLGGTGLWDEADGFYYDQLHVENLRTPLRVRSLVGLVPLFAVEILEEDLLSRLPGFSRRFRWFVENRPDIAGGIACLVSDDDSGHEHRLLALASRERLERVLRYALDEDEFLSPFGIRSVSRVHERAPFVFHADGREYRVDYDPGESTTDLFGGNSNWRGPIWFPMNFLLIESLERFHHFYGDSLKAECPVGSGNWVTLLDVARELSRRLASIFLPDETGRRPCHGDDQRYRDDPHWANLLLFHEYFHGETGRGCGASHQTGWTALVAPLISDIATTRDSESMALR